MARQLLAVTKKRCGPGNAKNAGRQGAAKLNRAASDSMKENGAGIARNLLQGAMKGDLASLRYLFELAQGLQEKTDVGKARLTRSIASELAAEPLWHDELKEAKAETGFGGLESQS